MDSPVKAMKRSIKYLSFDHSFEEKKKITKECLSVRSAPKDKKSLCVAPKKVIEVENWFNSLFFDHDSNASRILLLTGPSGAGKTATINVLADEFGLTIDELGDNSYCVDKDCYSRIDELLDVVDPLFRQESQLTQFKRHLMNANTSLNSSVYRKLIVVEDFPLEFRRNPKQFIDVVRQYLQDFPLCVPIVFILNVSTNVDFFFQSMFPDWFIKETNTCLITFNPVTAASIVSVLGKLCNDAIIKEDLKQIAESSGGDIRNAINTFELKCGHILKKLGIGSINLFGKAKKQRFSIASCLDVGGKDFCPTFFHSLGKILYCKRLDEWESSLSLLPQHLNNYARKKLKSNPEEIVDGVSVNVDTLNSYLHEHYLKFTSDLKQLSDCVSVMSDMDAFFSKINWQSSSTWSRLSNYVVVRNLMFSLSNGGHSRPQHFANFTKPINSNVEKSQQELKLQLSQSNNFISNSLDEYIVDISPYVSLINDTPMETMKQECFIRENSVLNNFDVQRSTLLYASTSRETNSEDKTIYTASDDEIDVDDVDLS